LDSTEALRYVVAEFLDSIREGRKPLLTERRLRVVRLLTAAQQSIKNGGMAVNLLSTSAQV
jgi:hypothetical protein